MNGQNFTLDRNYIIRLVYYYREGNLVAVQILYILYSGCWARFRDVCLVNV